MCSFLLPVFAVHKADHPAHSFWKNKSFDPKTPHIALFARFFDDQNSYFLNKNCRLNLFYSYYAPWNKPGACFTDVVFFSQFRRVVKAVESSVRVYVCCHLPARKQIIMFYVFQKLANQPGVDINANFAFKYVYR